MFIMEYNIGIETEKIKERVCGERVISALSGGVDSSVATILAYRAGVNLEAYFIDDYFRKKDEYTFVKEVFADLGIEVQLCYIRNEMLNAFKGVSDNTQKRPIFRKIFYDTFGKLIQEKGVRYLLQGTIKVDQKMFEKGQLQHNIGIPFEDYGIENVIEPLSGLYKHEVREVARALRLPKEISERQPFPGPGLLIRCLGEVTKEKIDLIKEGLAVAEEELAVYNPFQVVVAVSDDLVCSMRNRAVPDKYMLIVRAVKSKDAMTAKGIIPSQDVKDRLEDKLMNISDKIGRVLWDPTNKPDATIEYI